ncbi:MAG: hypothetical protein GX577_03995 [Leptolinea sp.]|nr:hypothetical protein [Leptolinea sp.]
MIDRKRLFIYLGFAFGIAWLAGLIIYLTGGLVDSPVLVPGTPLTLALVLLSFVYMWAPALGNLLTRLITRQGWSDLLLRMQFKNCWKPLLAACSCQEFLQWLGEPFIFFSSPYILISICPSSKNFLRPTVRQPEWIRRLL